MKDAREEIDLLNRWREGNEHAGEILMDRNFPRIKSFFARKTSDHELIKELTQRTFMRCLDKVSTFEGRSSFSSFIYGIAHHILLEYFREQRRSERSIPISETPVADLDPSPFSIVERKSERKLIIHALRRLPLQMQIIAELYFFEELSGREIGEVLGVSEGTVRGRIRSCRKQLKEHIHALAESPQQLESTLMTLSLWGKQVREQI